MQHFQLCIHNFDWLFPRLSSLCLLQVSLGFDIVPFLSQFSLSAYPAQTGSECWRVYLECKGVDNKQREFWQRGEWLQWVPEAVNLWIKLPTLINWWRVKRFVAFLLTLIIWRVIWVCRDVYNKQRYHWKRMLCLSGCSYSLGYFNSTSTSNLHN